MGGKSDGSTKTTATGKQRKYNTQNLSPVKTSEEARERGRNGGLAAARNRRERKKSAEILDILLKMPLKSGPEKSMLNARSLSKEDLEGTNPVSGELLILSMLQQALNGSTKCMRMIHDILNENQTVRNVSPLDELADKIDEYKEENDEEEEE